MHFITGIIVKTDTDSTDEEIKLIAEDAISVYEGDVWDWYDVSGGRWRDNLENKNVFRSDEEDFFKNIDKLIEYQKENLMHYKNMIKEQNKDEEYERYMNGERGESNEFYYYYCVSKLMRGYFCCDSHIFDAEDCTSRITNEMIDGYRNNPGEYAIVMIDMHF